MRRKKQYPHDSWGHINLPVPGYLSQERNSRGYEVGLNHDNHDKFLSDKSYGEAGNRTWAISAKS